MKTENGTPATFTNAAVAKLYHWAGIVREAVVLDHAMTEDPSRVRIAVRQLHEAVIAAKPEIAALTAKAAALDALVEAVRCTLQAHVIDGIGGPVRRELNDALSAAKAAQVSK